ncbi:MAG: TIGR03086 family metal-binding protein [Acidimicrobiia bacterium]
MTDPIELIDAMLTEAHRLIEGVAPGQLGSPTPCGDFDVRALLDHMCTWATVFDGTANDRLLDFDPEAFTLEVGWAECFAKAASGIVTGLRQHGYDRPMVMTSDPLPGFIVVDMLSMEYIGHGLDIAASTGQSHRFTAEQAEAALSASERLIQPDYRGLGEGQFHPIVEVGPDAGPFQRFVGFLGRDPGWSPPA